MLLRGALPAPIPLCAIALSEERSAINEPQKVATTHDWPDISRTALGRVWCACIYTYASPTHVDVHSGPTNTDVYIGPTNIHTCAADIYTNLYTYANTN